MKLYIIAVIFIVYSSTNALPTEDRSDHKPLHRLMHSLKQLPNHFVKSMRDIISKLHIHKDYPFQNPLWEQNSKQKATSLRN